MTSQTTVIAKRPIDFTDTVAVAQELQAFRDKYANASAEYALVISLDGNVYELRGTAVSVDPGVVGDCALRGCVLMHNHPPVDGVADDSFSRNDFVFFLKRASGRCRLFLRICIMRCGMAVSKFRATKHTKHMKLHRL